MSIDIHHGDVFVAPAANTRLSDIENARSDLGQSLNFKLRHYPKELAFEKSGA
jgi:hypothetical protein